MISSLLEVYCLGVKLIDYIDNKLQKKIGMTIE